MSASKDLRRFFVSIRRDTRNYGGLEYEYEHCDHGEFVAAEEAIDMVKEIEKERDALAAKIENVNRMMPFDWSSLSLDEARLFLRDLDRYLRGEA